LTDICVVPPRTRSRPAALRPAAPSRRRGALYVINNFFIFADAFAAVNKQIGNPVIDFPQSSPTLKVVRDGAAFHGCTGSGDGANGGPAGSNPRRVFILGVSVFVI
jgi:hypothetical protein